MPRGRDKDFCWRNVMSENRFSRLNGKVKGNPGAGGKNVDDIHISAQVKVRRVCEISWGVNARGVRGEEIERVCCVSLISIQVTSDLDALT